MGSNRFSLSRNIPSNIKREVRKRCGFGCARCGATIYEYEHFFPDFKDAKVHDAKSIVLLCPSCHGLVSKGVIPKEQVADFRENPKAVEQGFSKEKLPVFRGIPSLRMGGGGLIHKTAIPIQVKGKPVIEFGLPEKDSDITQVSCFLTDAVGDNFLTIDKNEWQVHSGNWDFEWIGNKYIFKTAKGDVMLCMSINAPHHISIDFLITSINGVPIIVDSEHLQVGNAFMSGCVMSYADIGFNVS